MSIKKLLRSNFPEEYPEHINNPIVYQQKIIKTNLQQLFKKSGMTQKKIAAIYPVSQGLISQYIFGKKNIGAKPLKRFAEIFGVTRWYLWTEH